MDSKLKPVRYAIQSSAALLRRQTRTRGLRSVRKAQGKEKAKKNAAAETTPVPTNFSFLHFAVLLTHRRIFTSCTNPADSRWQPSAAGLSLRA